MVIKNANGKTVLSTIRAEFIALIEGFGLIILLMSLLEEMLQQGVSMINSMASIHCKVFEDNSGALHIATLPKLAPTTKYIKNYTGILGSTCNKEKYRFTDENS